MTRPRLTHLTLALAIAASTHAQAKRATLDPNAGWEAATSETVDPARAELDEARSLIAREEPAKA